MPRAIIHSRTLWSGDCRLFPTPLEFDYNLTGLRLHELSQGAESMSWMAWNREKDSASMRSFLVLQLDRPGLNPSSMWAKA